ncbi:MAG: hypothetical protein MZV70_05580 [Desulfobacterales bacterium]|nr:hypothetical protein [Desulfobacterales bacterium]
MRSGASSSRSCRRTTAPAARGDAGATTDEDTPVTIDVLANDEDPDGDALGHRTGRPAAPRRGDHRPGRDRHLHALDRIITVLIRSPTCAMGMGGPRWRRSRSRSNP